MGDFWSSRIFFLAIWWAGYIFQFFSHKLSIKFVLHAIFFFQQPLSGIFFFKITHPPAPQELNGRPLRCLYYQSPGGTPLRIYVPPQRVFAPFWSENGCRLCSFLVWNLVWFSRALPECTNVFIVSVSNE